MEPADASSAPPEAPDDRSPQARAVSDEVESQSEGDGPVPQGNVGRQRPWDEEPQDLGAGVHFGDTPPLEG